MSSNINFLFIFAAIFLVGTLEVINGIGVNYGTLGNNLPSPFETIDALKSKGIKKIRIFTPNQEILQALRRSGISVLIGTLNEDLPMLSEDLSFATKWVHTNIVPFVNTVKILGISAGNELETHPLGMYVLGAMKNLYKALKIARIKVPVTTTVSYGVMGISYPPSNGSFNPNALEFITPVAKFLNSKGYPLLANIYPYFAYVGNPQDINIDYALLKENFIAIMDNNRKYTNLLVSMVDALYSSLEKVDAGNVRVIVSETGWPSAQGSYATIENAEVYNNNLIRLVQSGKGTPRRPNTKLDVYIFAVYNENQKPEGIEQNWGLFYPTLEEVYRVNFDLHKSESYVNNDVFTRSDYEWSLDY